MTRPRRHVEGQVVLATRRCLERRFYTRPDEAMNNIATYEFARASSGNNVDLHGAMVMSNHVHIVMTDVKGHRSDFMRNAMSGIARARNRDLGRRGYFWDECQYGDTVLLECDAQERKLLYTWLNPVLAGLVDRAVEWPGFKILPRDWGKTIRVQKPDSFYGRKSPEFVEFTPQPPPGYGKMRLKKVKARFEKLLKKAEDTIIKDRERAGERVAGVPGVLAILPTSRPSTPAPVGQISPRFASKDPDILAAAIAREKAFLSDYARQRERWLKGKKRVVFPCGTLWLRRNAPVKCQEFDPMEAGLAANM